MKLWEFHNKWIKITDIDGQIFTGRADLYTSELDNPDGVESLCIWQSGSENLIEFEEHEIAHIELISVETHTMAEAV